MISAIVLVKADPTRIPQCATKLAGIEGVSRVYSVSGEWDLVALIEVPDFESVARVVTEEKKIFPNVDLFSGAGYAAMGIATDQFTPIFAMSRVVGWAAHVMEQHANNRLIRPRAEYTGPTHATYIPIDKR